MMIEEAVYRIGGMTCAGCARSVVHAIANRSPGLRVEVDLEQATAHVQGLHEEESVRQAVEQAGFQYRGRA